MVLSRGKKKIGYNASLLAASAKASAKASLLAASAKTSCLDDEKTG